jgi:hypothetical protein
MNWFSDGDALGTTLRTGASTAGGVVVRLMSIDGRGSSCMGSRV